MQQTKMSQIYCEKLPCQVILGLIVPLNCRLLNRIIRRDILELSLTAILSLLNSLALDICLRVWWSVEVWNSVATTQTGGCVSGMKSSVRSIEVSERDFLIDLCLGGRTDRFKLWCWLIGVCAWGFLVRLCWERCSGSSWSIKVFQRRFVISLGPVNLNTPSSSLSCLVHNIVRSID